MHMLPYINIKKNIIDAYEEYEISFSKPYRLLRSKYFFVTIDKLYGLIQTPLLSHRFKYVDSNNKTDLIFLKEKYQIKRIETDISYENLEFINSMNSLTKIIKNKANEILKPKNNIPNSIIFNKELQRYFIRGRISENATAFYFDENGEKKKIKINDEIFYKITNGEQCKVRYFFCPTICFQFDIYTIINVIIKIYIYHANCIIDNI